MNIKMTRYNNVFGFDIYLNGLSFEEFLIYNKECMEEIPEMVELTTSRNCFKKIKELKLRKEFELFLKNNNTLNEKEKYILFIKEYTTELNSQIDKWLEIFKGEEPDRTNKKHRETLKKIVNNVNKIDEISFIFNPTTSKKYKSEYFKFNKNRCFFKQNNY